MKLEYVDIKRTIEACKMAIGEAKTMIGMNELILAKMEDELKTGNYPKPKFKKEINPIVK